MLVESIHGRKSVCVCVRVTFCFQEVMNDLYEPPLRLVFEGRLLSFRNLQPLAGARCAAQEGPTACLFKDAACRTRCAAECDVLL